MGEKRRSSKKRDKIISDNTYFAKLEFKEKGWKKHQRIATSAAIASKLEPSYSKNECVTPSTLQNKSTSNQYKNNYVESVEYHSDSDEFGVFDIADFAKQINKIQKQSNSQKKIYDEKEKEKKDNENEKKRE